MLKGKAALATAVSLILSMMVTVCAWAAGYFTAGENTLPWIVLTCCMFGIAAVLMTVNVILGHRFKKRLRTMSAQEGYRLGLALQEETESDYRVAEKKVTRTMIAGYCYLVFLIVLFVWAAFCFGRTRTELDGVILISLLLIFLSAICFYLFFAPVETGDRKADELDRTRFPLLFETIGRAAADMRCTLPVRICLGDDGTAIAQRGGKVVVYIDPIECGLLTSDELYNVMLHEFAHVAGADTRRKRRIGVTEERWANTSGTLADFARWLFFGYMADLAVFRFETYTMLSSRYYETCADDAVREKGDPQTYVNACAKAAFYGLFCQLPNRALSFDAYESEQPIYDLAERTLASYRTYAERYGEVWTGLLKRELPARVASHPTLKMRMERMGIETFDAHAVERDPDYCAEQAALGRLAGENDVRRMGDAYEELRRERYLKPKALIEQYQNAKNAGEEIDEGFLVRVARTMYAIDPDESLFIADRLLSSQPEHAVAHALKGIVLYNRYDPSCVEHFYRAMAADYSLTPSLMELVGEFALRTGDQALLDRYRSEVADSVQAAEDKGKSDRWDKTKPLDREVPEAVRRTVLAVVSERQGVRALYLAAFAGTTGTIAVTAVQFEKKMSPVERYELLKELIDRVEIEVGPNALAVYGITPGSLMRAVKRAGIAPAVKNGVIQ